MSEQLVYIHVPARKTPLPEGSTVDPGLAEWGRATLAEAVQEQGIAVVFSRGADAFDRSAGVATVYAPRIERTDRVKTGYEVHVREEEVAIDSLGAVRLPMEVNGGEPQLVYEEEHGPTARLHARLLAQQLRRVADAGSTILTGAK